MSAAHESCDYVHKGKPGLYKMAREILVGGRYRRNEMIVRNPAFGAQVLNAWEESLRAEADEPRPQERASSLGRARQRAA